MVRPRSLFASLAVTGALATALVGCSSSPEENSAAACDAYAAFVVTVEEARASLSASSTVAEIADARDNVKEAYGTLDDALGDVNADRKADLEKAWTAYDDSVSDIDTSLTVPEAAKTLTEEVGSIESAQAALSEDLVCE